MKKEKERKNWRENLVTSLEIPRDLALKETVFTLTGQESCSNLQLQKHSSLSAAGTHCAGISGKLVSIRGKRLIIP